MKQKVYITQANLQTIVRRSHLSDLEIAGRVWKREIYFFNKFEKNSLLAIQQLLANPEEYFKKIYVPHRPKDSGHFVLKECSPSYHSDKECGRLNSDFENFVIPEVIRSRGPEAIEKFRKWFEKCSHLLNDKPELFNFRMKNEWQLEGPLEHIVYKNSGFAERDDLSIQELESQIDQRIKKAGQFYYASPKNKAILQLYSKRAYLGRCGEPLEQAVPGYGESEVKEFLTEYEAEYKWPLIADLTEYYRLDLNPDIEMSGQILGLLGFKPCTQCYQMVSSVNEKESCEIPF